MRKLFLVFLLGIFMLSFTSAVSLLYDFGNATTDNNQNALCFFNQSAFNFTAPTNMQLTDIGVFVTEDSGVVPTIIASIYYANSSHQINGTLVGSPSNPRSDANFAVGQVTNFTFPAGKTNLTQGQEYWVTFNCSSPGGQFIRIGETTATGASIWANGGTLINMAYNQGTGAGNQVTTASIDVWGDVIQSVPSNVVNAPANNTNYLSGTLITFNVSHTSILQNLTNSTIFIDNVANSSINLTGTSNTSIYNLTFTNPGQYQWLVQSCNIFGCANTSVRFFNISRIIFNSQTFTTPESEGVSTLFTINISTNATTLSSVNLNYSGTSYAATIYQVGSYFIANRTITTPLVSGSSNKSFNWLITNSEGVTLNTTFSNQTVNDILLGNCSTYNFTLYNFSIVDEDTQVLINQTVLNTYAEVDFQLYLSDGTSLLQSFSQAYNRTNPFQVCFSSNVTGNFILDGQVQYSADGYVREFYNIQNENITYQDLNTNITLYDLNSTRAQEFLITYTDENFNPVVDALILIQRKYISEGLFKTVEIPITDSNGETLANLVLSDVVYTFTVMKNGELLATFENQLAFCDNIATGDCTIPLNVYGSTTIPDTFANVGNYTFNIDYNRTTRVVTTSFAVASGITTTNLLNVTLFDGRGTTQLCTQTLTSSAGTLQCTVPQSYENSTLIVSLSKDGNLAGRAIISNIALPSEVYGQSRVFIAVMAFLLIIGIGVAQSPVIMGILMIIGAILLLSFNMITSAGVIGQTASILWLIVAIVLIMIKGARR